MTTHREDSSANQSMDKLSGMEKLRESNEISHQGSETTFPPPEITPAYKNDDDLERGIEIIPEDETKLADNASAESLRKIGGAQETDDDEGYPPGIVTRTWRRYRPFGHAIIWLLLTAYDSRRKLLKADGGFVD